MKHLLIVILFISPAFIFGQDMIYTLKGDAIEAKVNEVGKKEIVYKKFSNIKGPDYKMNIIEINRIVYESGAVDVFNEIKSNSGSTFKVSPSDLGNNHIYLNVVDILFQNVTLGYERIVGEQRKLGIRIPVSFSLYGNSLNDIFFNSYNVFYSGVDLNFYPFGQRQASFFIGPSLRSGLARFRYEIYDDFNYSSVITSSAYASILFQGGFTWNPVKELTITSSLGLGSRRYFDASPNNRNTVTTASFWFAFGYRF